MSTSSDTYHDASMDLAVTADQSATLQQLLQFTANLHSDSHDPTRRGRLQCHAFANAPLFSLAAQAYAEQLADDLPIARPLVPQHGLIGSREASDEHTKSVEDQLIMANLNVPWSAFICGSQGAGKSHTLSCLLEACLIRDNPTTTLSHPMAGLVFHFDRFTSVSTTQICEAAHLCSSGIPVRILVTPSNIWNMDRIYRDLLRSTEHGDKVEVVPLYLNESQLNITTLLKLMAFDPNGTTTPLYMEVVMRIIREIAMEGNRFTYRLFRERLAAIDLLPGQKTPLNMRLQLLETFLAPELTPQSRKPAACEQNIWDFQPGTLTIIDLGDPFLSSDDACSLFSICLAIFLEDRTSCSRVIALDEAHKFLTQSGAAAVLTEDLTSVIRQQRHIATRVFTATQEPTLSPKLIDLSNATFVHRFSSPSWYKILKEHLAGATGVDQSAPSEQRQQDIFKSITELQTGQALVFCPTAQVCAADGGGGGIESLAGRHMRVHTRKRVTFDGGVSLVATAKALEATHIYDGSGGSRIRMHEPASLRAVADSSQPRGQLNQLTLPTQPAQPAQPPVQHAVPFQSNNGPPTPAPSIHSSPVLMGRATLPVNYIFEDTDFSTYKRVKAKDSDHVRELACQFAIRLAEYRSWSRETTIDTTSRQEYLEAFRHAVRVKAAVCRGPHVKVIFFDALRMVLVRTYVITFLPTQSSETDL